MYPTRKPSGWIFCPISLRLSQSQSVVGVSATERWLVFLSIRVARPRARARQRFRVGPSSTRMSAIRRSSATRSWFASALAAAESISFARSRAAPRVEKASSVRASSTGMPRTWSATSRALRGATRTYRALARTMGASGSLSPDFATARLTLLAAVAAERPRRRELAELVADHRLGDEHGHVLAAVVDGDRVPDHLREHGRGPRPGLVHLLDAPHEALLDVRALLRRTSHSLPRLLLPPPASADDHRVRALALLAGAVAERGLAPRGHGVP